jgi:tetratricopeptide (TPR) repeat protein
MTRTCLNELSQSSLDSELRVIFQRLESETFHRGDLGLARAMAERGHMPIKYLVDALETALKDGRYEDVWKVRSDISSATIDRDSFILVHEKFLRAAQHLGKHRKEIAVLQDLLKETPTESAQIGYRKILAKALASLGKWEESLVECKRIEQSNASSEGDILWSLLQKAETLWQAGRFHEADSVYESVEQELRSERSEEWLRYSVGRARQSGQRGDMDGVARFLQSAEDVVGAPVCARDPLFLNTLGGMKVELAEYREAASILDMALRRAVEMNEWDVYVMVSHRACSVEYGLGRMWEAARIGRDGVATSVALGSDRISVMISSMVAYPEAILGRIGPSFRCAETMMRTAMHLKDQNLLVQAHRLRAFVAAYAGWRQILDEAEEAIRDVGGLGAEEGVAYVHYCRGIQLIGAHRWSEAKSALKKALKRATDTGHLGLSLRIQLLLIIASVNQESITEVLSEIQGLKKKLAAGKYPALVPIADLAEYKIRKDPPSAEKARAAMVQMWENGRFLEILDWVPEIYENADDEERRALKRQVVDIVQRSANTLDDASLRSQFLSSRRVRAALELARS